MADLVDWLAMTTRVLSRHSTLYFDGDQSLASREEDFMSNYPTNRRITIDDLARFKREESRFSALTAYDALTAGIFDEAEIPLLLVGDSAGNNFLGEVDTIPVTMDEMIPLARAVVRGSKRSMVIADMPFGSYERSDDQALENAIRFLKEAGVHGIKLEGGVRVQSQVKALTKAGIAVMGHIGLTPQSVNALGGYRVQGRGEKALEILADALALQEAGVFAIVLEMVPAELAREISSTLSIPTIGIGAGSSCDGQILVWTDLLGLTAKPPKFSAQYLDLRSQINSAVTKWRDDVASGAFPEEKHSFH
jgi:3-methyl-2-oxobutanoate hydroxymethyltransferase